MTRLLIPDVYQILLITTLNLNVEVARIRMVMGVADHWILCPSLTEFYDPTGQTADAIAAHLALRPKVLHTRTLLRRMTGEEVQGIALLAQSDVSVASLWSVLLSGPTVNVQSDEFLEGVAVIQVAGVPSVWPDADTAAARLAVITA